MRTPGLCNSVAFAEVWLIAGALMAVGLLPCSGQEDPFAYNSVETHRVRMENEAGGAVAVSPDGGESWQVVGHVTVPATTVAPGFAASQWAQDATVCATAVHGIRIRIGPMKDSERGSLVSIVPLEFASVPENYGGHDPAQSGVYTDIPAGTAIFRNLAPYLGNRVFVERGGQLVDPSAGYRPSRGDVLVIQVARPKRLPRWITLENRVGGDVIADFGDGEAYLFARVTKTVRGVGRFDATGYTGVGCINTNHTGVVTISTAPDFNGQPLFDDPFGETRGGFMIQPVFHAGNEARAGGPIEQVMVVEAVARGRDLEGTPPLFVGFLGLAFQSRDPASSFVCEMQVDGGDFEPLVESIGINPQLFTARGLERALDAAGRGRMVSEGVTAFRIRFPEQPQPSADE